MALIDEVTQRFELESELRFALERDEFVVHYQPVYDLESRTVVGTEALLRWNHPTRGLIPPSGFIPLAEQTGLIIPIGEFVLETACQQVVDWDGMQPARPRLGLSVNVSPRQLTRPGFVHFVSQVIADTRLRA